MTIPTSSICLAILVIVLLSLLFKDCNGKRQNDTYKTSQSHKRDHAVASLRGGLTYDGFAVQMRKLLCGACPDVWKIYAAPCVDKSLKPVRECGDVSEKYEKDHADEFTRASKCLEKRRDDLANECQYAVGIKRKGRSSLSESYDGNYDDSDMYTMVKDGTYDEESDAPIGWRTIQGEWFQELRASSAP